MKRDPDKRVRDLPGLFDLTMRMRSPVQVTLGANLFFFLARSHVPDAPLVPPPSQAPSLPGASNIWSCLESMSKVIKVKKRP